MNGEYTQDSNDHAVIIFDISLANDRESFKIFSDQCKENNHQLHFVDDYNEQLNELCLLKDPSILKQGKIAPQASEDDIGIWVVYPWKDTAVRTLPAADFHKLRLSRNKELITDKEQQVLSTATIAIAGLNVGNPAAVCLAQEGIGSTYRMADNDTLSLSNLNRFRAGLCELGLNKAVISARQALEIDPFLAISVLNKGIDQSNLSEFVKGSSIVIEEMDNLPLKIAIRKEARSQRIPVIMVTGNGHDIILDVERYDLDADLPLLSGLLSEEVQREVALGEPSFERKVALARDFMGARFLNSRLLQSFDEMGNTLIGIPQLAEASFLRGAALTHTVRQILLSNNVPSGRYAFGLSDLYQKQVNLQ